MLIESFSGIRGVYGKDLTLDMARRYAFVFHEFLGEKYSRMPRIVVGYDTRESSEALKEAILDALFDVIDVGIMPVAAVELAVREYKADGGVMITASHNEPEFNGLKFLGSSGAILGPTDVDVVIENFTKIKGLSEEEFSRNFLYKEELIAAKRIEKRNKEMIGRYAKFLRGILGKFKNQTKVVVDVNGGAGVVLGDLLKNIPVTNLILVNTKPGQFRRRIEPDGESLSYLRRVIKKEGAEFGAGFDCDADRMQIILKDGSIVDGNYLLGLIVDYILGRKKGVVVVNDATSGLIKEIAEKHGCKIEEVEVGEANVVQRMLELKSPIGGEGSNGGIIVPPSTCRDGILSLFLVLRILNDKKRGLQELIKEYPGFITVQKKIVLEKGLENRAIKERVHAAYRGCEFRESGGETGGLKVIMDNAFLWFRVSKTEPNLLRIIADSRSKKRTGELLEGAEALFLNR